MALAVCRHRETLVGGRLKAHPDYGWLSWSNFGAPPCQVPHVVPHLALEALRPHLCPAVDDRPAHLCCLGGPLLHSRELQSPVAYLGACWLANPKWFGTANAAHLMHNEARPTPIQVVPVSPPNFKPTPPPLFVVPGPRRVPSGRFCGPPPSCPPPFCTSRWSPRLCSCSTATGTPTSGR